MVKDQFTQNSNNQRSNQKDRSEGNNFTERAQYESKRPVEEKIQFALNAPNDN